MKAENKNILYVIPTLNYGGAEIQTIHQLNYLTSNGNNNVFLLVLSNHLAAIEKLDMPAERITICHQSSILTLSSFSNGSVSCLVRETYSTIKERNISHIISILPLSHFVCRLAKMRLIPQLKRPKLYTYYRALDFRDLKNVSFRFKLFNCLNSQLAFLLDNGSIFISEACRNNISKHFFTRHPFTISNSIPYKKVDSQAAEKYFAAYNNLKASFKVLFPGRFFKTKGHSFFFEVMKEFIEVNGISEKSIQIICAGYGTEYEEKKIKDEASPISKYVLFTGRVDNDLMLSMMAFCDLIVIPSLDEGFGNVAIEGLMQKAVVLSSDAGGLKDIIEDGVSGFQFKAGDKSELLKKLDYIILKRADKKLCKSKIFDRYTKRYTIQRYFKNFNEQLDLNLQI